ncbi:hypothetical protein EYF80_066100 [Liparis tanakae]|uniref:Uncharacterized protein n=1 Tax=Liparis tanakae TaxID=230148 RepID=A0A4Z2E4U1_9TELE|nr:hypothetical protein EYF80_066100 [Liparis tanakae]
MPRAEVHEVHLRRPLHQHQPHQGAGVRRRVPPGSDAPKLDRRRLQPEAVGAAGRRRRRPGMAVRQRQDSHPAHPAAVPGRQRENVQNHRGHLVQVQEVLEAAQRVGRQVRGAGPVAAAGPAQAQVQEQEAAREEPAQRELARRRALKTPYELSERNPTWTCRSPEDVDYLLKGTSFRLERGSSL